MEELQTESIYNIQQLTKSPADTGPLIYLKARKVYYSNE